jgi:hypothetical protein
MLVLLVSDFKDTINSAALSSDKSQSESPTITPFFPSFSMQFLRHVFHPL